MEKKETSNKMEKKETSNKDVFSSKVVKIKITKDHKDLKKGQSFEVSGHTAELLVDKGIAEII